MNILTFDIEEWFHILDHDSTKTEKEWSNFEYRLESNMDRIFGLLDKKNQKATFFVLGWVAREFPEVLKKIDSMGFEIATHSDKHQLAYEQNKRQFNEDLKSSIQSIENVIGKKVTTYRAPGFSVKEANKWVFESLIENGIKIDCSIFPAERAHGGFQNFGAAEPALIDYLGTTIKEFPINTVSIMRKDMVFSGGGYFRFLPYWLIKRFMQNSDYVMTYFHPRDFDSMQPMINDLSLTRKFKSYYGLETAFTKLEKLISDFDFIDIATANNLIDWNSQKRIRLQNENIIFNRQLSPGS
jgi:polysaccharide deacetylase family protein (PEP-CTERM system associated)